MKTVVYTIVAMILLGVVSTAVVVLGGVYDFAADRPHWSVVEKVIGLARHRSVDRQAATVPIPDNLRAADRLARGASGYQAMCSACHQAPSTTDGALRDGLYPPPPDLTEQGIHDPASAFWVIKHGIKMTGMPAWGASHDDEALWDLVALLEVLPELSEEEWIGLLLEHKEMEQEEPGQEGKDGHTHRH